MITKLCLLSVLASAICVTALDVPGRAQPAQTAAPANPPAAATPAKVTAPADPVKTKAPITSEDTLTLGDESAHRLRAQGEMALNSGQVDRALKSLERSVKLNPHDVDARSAYARALQQQWSAEKPGDPRVFNRCVKQWLWVARKAEFPDQSGEAKAQLKALTGHPLRIWERDGKYLEKVLMAEDVPPAEAVIGGPKKKNPKGSPNEDKMFIMPMPGTDSVR